MRKILLICVLLIAQSAFCQNIKIAAAADLRLVLAQLTATYKKLHPEASFSITPGGSGMLFQQIANGADFDLFLSASKSYPDQLIEQGFADNVTIYAYGRLALYSKNITPVKQADQMLLNENVNKIVVANPAIAPYGQKAVESLKKLGLYEKVKSKLVFAENIAQAVQFVESGSADAGLVALSLVNKQPANTWILVPEKSYTPIDQALTILKKSKNKKATFQFVQFLKSAKAKAIFKQFGFKTP